MTHEEKQLKLIAELALTDFEKTIFDGKAKTSLTPSIVLQRIQRVLNMKVDPVDKLRRRLKRIGISVEIKYTRMPYLDLQSVNGNKLPTVRDSYTGRVITFGTTVASRGIRLYQNSELVIPLKEIFKLIRRYR